MKYLISLVVAYILAAPFTSLISLDMRQTEWLNLATYIWIIGGWILWVLFAAIIALTLTYFSNKHPRKRYNNWHNRR